MLLVLAIHIIKLQSIIFFLREMGRVATSKGMTQRPCVSPNLAGVSRADGNVLAHEPDSSV
jgi:hypothetical protein